MSGESRPSKPISVDTPKFPTLSGLSSEHQETRLHRFRLPWSHYARLLTVKGKEARAFYETEALREGWSVRQLDPQIATQFYERTALTRNKAAWRRAESPANYSPCLNREKIWEITTVFDAQEPIQASCHTAWMNARMIGNPNGRELTGNMPGSDVCEHWRRLVPLKKPATMMRIGSQNT